MLYLVVHCDSESGREAFDTLLSPEGARRAQHLSTLMETLGVQSVFTAPNRRSLDTLLPYTTARAASGKYLRTEVHYNLSNAVLIDFSYNSLKPQPMTLEFIKKYGLNRQSLYGTIPGLEDLGAHQRRVIEWYTNHLIPEYEGCPYPTAIVADRHTIATLVSYMMTRKGTGTDQDAANAVVSALAPGAVLEFGFDNMALALKRRVI